MATQALLSRGLQNGEESKWQHNACRLGVHRAKRNQNGFITPAVSQSEGAQTARNGIPSREVLDSAGKNIGQGPKWPKLHTTRNVYLNTCYG